LLTTAVQNTKKLFKTREERDLLFGSMIGATVIAIIVTSANHFIHADQAGLERIVIGGVSGGFGGVIGLLIISEVVNRKWLSAVLLSVFVGVLDGLLVGVAVALFPSMF
jgi:hypothetical protein